MIFSTPYFLASMRGWLLIALLPVLLIQLGCASSTPSQNFVGSPFKPGSSEAGEFVWHDLLTGDPEVAKQFYGSLFGWGFESKGRVTHITLNRRVIGSIMEMPVVETETAHVPRWVASLGVADVVKATDWTLQQGGAVHEGPRQMRNRGEVALVSDPLGAQIGLVELGLKKTTGPSPALINDWLWDELWTKDTAKALSFYSGLYEFEADEATPGYWILKSGEQWRAGVRELFDPDLEQRWVPVIRVDDVQAISMRTQELGGRLMLAAEQGDTQDETALLADPGGALFMVQEWSVKEEPEDVRK